MGDSNRTCQATGEWSGSISTCQGLLLRDNVTLSYVHVHTEHNNYSDVKVSKLHRPFLHNLMCSLEACEYLLAQLCKISA